MSTKNTKKVFKVKSSATQGSTSTGTGNTVSHDQHGGNVAHNAPKRKGKSIKQDATAKTVRESKKKRIRKKKTIPLKLNQYLHCGTCNDGVIWYCPGAPSQLPADVILIGICRTCHTKPTRVLCTMYSGPCFCGCGYDAFIRPGNDGDYFNTTEDPNQFIATMDYLADPRASLNAVTKQYGNVPLKHIVHDNTAILNGLAQMTVMNNALGVGPPVVTGPAPAPIGAPLVATPAVVAPVVPATTAVPPVNNELVKLQQNKERYDQKYLYSDLFNAIDKIILLAYSVSNVMLRFNTVLAGYTEVFSNGTDIYSPWSKPLANPVYIVWPDVSEQMYVYQNMSGFIFTDIKGQFSVHAYGQKDRLKVNAFLIQDTFFFNSAGGNMIVDVNKLGEVGEFALWHLTSQLQTYVPVFKDFVTGYGGFLIPHEDCKIFIRTMPNKPYVKIVLNREAWLSGMKYISGKPLTSDTMRNITSVVVRCSGDSEAVSEMTSELMRENIKVSKNINRGMADRNGIVNWFVKTYRSVRNHNLLTSNPFGDHWDLRNILLGIFILMFLKVLYSKLPKRGNKPKVASVSYPFWLIIMMVRRLWNNRLSKKVYSSVEEFNYQYAGVSGRKDLQTYPSFRAKCMELVELKEVDATASVSDNLERFTCRPSFGNIAFGPILLDNVPLVPATCSHNCMVAVVNRGTKKRKAPLPGYWKLAASYIKELIPDPTQKIELGLCGRSYLAPVAFDSWFKHLSASSRRGIVQARKHKFQLHRRDARVKGFVKRENTPCFGDKRLTNEFNPRLISGRTFEYQFKTGPITYSISKTLAVFLNFDNRITYASGMTAEDVGNWFTEAVLMFKTPVICETDASGFDGSVSKDAIDAELSVYAYLGVPAKYLRYLRKQRKTFGFCGSVQYKVEATRKSGDGNTSCGNTTINALITHSIFRNVNYKAIILGDDGLIIFEKTGSMRDCAKRVENMWSVAGFTAKVHVFDDIFMAQFCSGRFYPLGERFKFGMKIFRGLSKIGFATKDFFKLSDVQVHRKGVGMGLLASVSHVPILRSVAQNYVASTRLDAQAVEIESYKMAATLAEPPQENTFEFVSHVYGLSRQQIDLLEQCLLSCQFPSVINFDFISRCCDIDASECRLPGVASLMGSIVGFLTTHCPRVVNILGRGVELCGHWCAPIVRRLRRVNMTLDATAAFGIGTRIFDAFHFCLRFLIGKSVNIMMGMLGLSIDSFNYFFNALWKSFMGEIDRLVGKMMAKPEVMHVDSNFGAAKMRFAVLYALFGAPLLEESIKLCYGMVAVVAISLLETIPHPFGTWVPVFLRQFIVHYLLLRLTRISPVLGMLAHSVFNYAVMRSA